MERFCEELLLPLVFASRVVKRKMSLKLAWQLMDTWWPFRMARRLRAKWRIWRATRYRGCDEFHRSLDMDVVVMLELTKDELEDYLEDLMRRRERLHERSKVNVSAPGVPTKT